MMQALLAAWVSVQDEGVVWSAHSRRAGTEYELVVSGKGLAEAGDVTLRLHRLFRRYDWDLGRFGLSAEEEVQGRVLHPVDGRFEHVERFKAPALVEARLAVGGESGRTLRKVWRVGSAAEAASAARMAAKRMETALRLLRSAFEDADVLGGPAELSARRARELKKRLDWRFSALREELEGSPLSGTATAVMGLVSDLEAALELLGSGSSIEGLISNLGGKPFTWAGARELERLIEALAVRERGLLALDLGEALRVTIGERARAGDAAAWTRFERTSDRALEDMGALVRGASSASEQESLREVVVSPLEETLGLLTDLIRCGSELISCTGASVEDFETQSEALRLQMERVQGHLQVANP